MLGARGSNVVANYSRRFFRSADGLIGEGDAGGSTAARRRDQEAGESRSWSSDWGIIADWGSDWGSDWGIISDWGTDSELHSEGHLPRNCR